jgi:hypothetical protein
VNFKFAGHRIAMRIFAVSKAGSIGQGGEKVAVETKFGLYHLVLNCPQIRCPE